VNYTHIGNPGTDGKLGIDGINAGDSGTNGDDGGEADTGVFTLTSYSGGIYSEDGNRGGAGGRGGRGITAPEKDSYSGGITYANWGTGGNGGSGGSGGTGGTAAVEATGFVVNNETLVQLQLVAGAGQGGSGGNGGSGGSGGENFTNASSVYTGGTPGHGGDGGSGGGGGGAAASINHITINIPSFGYIYLDAISSGGAGGTPGLGYPGGSVTNGIKAADGKDGLIGIGGSASSEVSYNSILASSSNNLQADIEAIAQGGQSSAGGSGSATVKISSNVIIGGSGNDTVGLYLGVNTFQFENFPGTPQMSAKDNTINLGGGDDTINLNFHAVGGGFVDVQGNHFDGGSGFNSISITSTEQLSVVYDVTNNELKLNGELNFAANFQNIQTNGPITLTIQRASGNALVFNNTNNSANFNVTFGGDGADTLKGVSGNHFIVGGLGGDILTGGSGNDTFAYTSAQDSTQAAPDFITDFQTGGDKIDLLGVSVNHISTIVNGAADFVFVETSSGQVMQINVAGTVQATDFSGVTTNYYMQGDSGNNTLIGGNGNDVIDGHGGNDLIIGGGASDALFGGAGQDTFKYMTVADSLQGSGADTIFDFQTGQDQIDLTALAINHISTIDNGTAEFVFIETTSGTLMQINFVGADAIQAKDFNVTGGTNFYIQGDSGNNTLIGGAGKDVIDGHGGNDLIIGGGGSDALFGGAGNDTFKYLAASDSTVAAPDTIFDFTSGTDKIDLTAVHTSSKDVFNILVSGGASYIFVDLGGDGVNDMLIQATGTVTISDILWNKPSDAVASSASPPPLHADEVIAQQFASDYPVDQSGDMAHTWLLHGLQPHTLEPTTLLYV
jgi:Ca2+-binding RTX toxin-like protein